MSNYYNILEITKDASDEEVKKAYKKMAKKCHPDKNRDNQEDATSKFKQISEAYQVLSDAETRRMYDWNVEEKNHYSNNYGFSSEEGKNRRECRYFKNGHCLKGEKCMFKHTGDRNTQKCRNGENCFFLKNNKCKFYHQIIPQKRMECWFRERCRNLVSCRFYHPTEDHNNKRSAKQVKECMWGGNYRNIVFCKLYHQKDDFQR